MTEVLFAVEVDGEAIDVTVDDPGIGVVVGADVAAIVTVGGGAPGASAYQIAVSNGFVGTEAEWLASLEGTTTWDDITGKPAVPWLTFTGAGNGTTDDRATVAATDTSALSANLHLLLPAGTYRVTSNLTITSPVMMQPGAVIKPDSGVTVTLAGGVSSPLSQIFDHSAGGLVVPKNVDYFHPAWWGPTGTTNDSQTWIDMSNSLVALAATVVYSTTGFGQRIIVPAGLNRIHGVTLANCEILAGRGNCLFQPPTGTTTGTMLTLDDFTRLNGGFVGAPEAGMAVTCVWQKGYRSVVDGLYINNRGINSIGLYSGDPTNSSTSPVVNNLFVIGGPTTASIPAGSVGWKVHSPDLQATNCTAALFDTGILFSRGNGGRLSNIHVWSNNTGISGDNLDATQWVSVYLDKNEVWGIDTDKMDRACWSGVYANANGGGDLQQTGGAIRCKQTSGSAQYSTFKNVVLSDNYDHGILVDGPDNYTFEVTLSSALQQANGNLNETRVGGTNPATGTPRAVTGVEITSLSSGTKLLLRGTDAVTPLINNGASTIQLANLDPWADKSAPSGTVAGTTDTQTFTGKTMSGASNTFTNISADSTVDGTTNKAYTATEKTKLSGIAAGATANSSDATLLDRANHTGAQPSSTISDFTEAAQDAVNALLVGASGVTLSYDDTANTLTITGGGAAGLDAEAVRDAIGVALVGTGLITVTVNDAADTITISTTATANDTDANLKDRANHTGTQSADTLTDGTTNKAFLATERTKLSGIAAGATANSSDATLLARANHTGTQTASTISDFSTAADARITAATATGSGSLVRATSPALVTPALGTPASGVLTNCTGLPTADNTAKLFAPVSYVAANYYMCQSPGNSSTTAIHGNSVLRVASWLVVTSVSVVRLFVEFTAAGEANSVFRLGIYNDDGTGKPGTLVLDAGTISTGTGNAGNVATGGTPGTYERTIAQTLAPGLYWVGGAVQGAATTQPTIRVTATADTLTGSPLGTTLPTAVTARGWAQASVAAALPATFTATPTVSGNVVRTGFRVA